MSTDKANLIYEYVQSARQLKVLLDTFKIIMRTGFILRQVFQRVASDSKNLGLMNKWWDYRKHYINFTLVSWPSPVLLSFHELFCGLIEHSPVFSYGLQSSDFGYFPHLLELSRWNFIYNNVIRPQTLLKF